jgi:hypothetical protein
MVAIEDQNEQFGLAHSMATLLGQCISELEIPHLLMGVCSFFRFVFRFM